MRAKKLQDLLQKGDRVAVSNITGREASKVSSVSQNYCGNIIGGWALGKGGQRIGTPRGEIPVFATFDELLRYTEPEKHPNKILIYSPPEAVYGEVKEVVDHGKRCVETLYIVTEHVSIEVTAKIRQIASSANIDVVGCNTLGIINTHDRVRIGAVGGNNPEESFKPGSVTIISNSGNMVNTISSYLLSSGMGTSFGIPTGKDRLILFFLKDFLILAERDKNTKLIVLYIEPGGTYEHDAIELMQKNKFTKPIVAYVAGEIAERRGITLGHAGAVVEGKKSSAQAKKEAFDGYFGIDPYKPQHHYRKTQELKSYFSRGIRVTALHHIPAAVSLVAGTLGLQRDFGSAKLLRLNPWFVNLGEIGKRLPPELALSQGNIPEPYAAQVRDQMKVAGGGMIRQPMRGSSHASSNDGITPRLYGYSLLEIMRKKSFVGSLILYWTGDFPRNAFEERLAELTLTASLTNGPGTISAQGAKLSASAGNTPNTAMMATLATTGLVHGGNGARAVGFLLDRFGGIDIDDPYLPYPDVKKLAALAADDFKKKKNSAKEAGTEYERIPCLGHPVFRTEAVNFDPREQVIYRYIKESNKANVFLDFYHELVRALKENGSTPRVLAVNLDAAIACVWLGICWKALRSGKITRGRVKDIAFIAFALGRAAGGAGEFLDHQDFGTEMDMRIPAAETRSLTGPRNLVS
jgi:succinyl-CoA synthetase alpha subunit